MGGTIFKLYKITNSNNGRIPSTWETGILTLIYKKLVKNNPEL